MDEALMSLFALISDSYLKNSIKIRSYCNSEYSFIFFHKENFTSKLKVSLWIGC